MGMSASQARLLFLTSRMNDIELKSQQISNTKIRLADESEQVANAYTKALNKTRLQYNIPGTEQSGQLTYNTIMSPTGDMNSFYNLQTVDGKVVVSHNVAAAFEKSRGNEYQAENISAYQTNYNNAVSTLNKAETTLNDYLKSKDVTVNSDGTLKFPTKILITIKSSSSTGGAGSAQGSGTVPTTDGAGSTGGAGGARAPRRIAAQNTNMFSKTQSDVAALDMGLESNPTTRNRNEFTMDPIIFSGGNGGTTGRTTGGSTTGGTTGSTTGGTTGGITGRITGRITDFTPKVIDLTPTGGTFTHINFKPTIDESLRRGIVDLYSSAEKSQIQAQYNIYKQNVSVAKQAVSDAKTALDNAKAKNASLASNPGEYSGEFYENLFKQMETNGYKAYDQKLLNNPEALQAYLGNGEWYIGKKNTDGKYAQISISSSTNFSEVTDKTDLAKAEAEYNAQTLKINNKEKKLDNQLKKLDTEHAALKTEQESIKSLIKDNVDKSFNLFS